MGVSSVIDGACGSVTVCPSRSATSKKFFIWFRFVNAPGFCDCINLLFWRIYVIVGESFVSVGRRIGGI
jgi:hypothetical protein